VFLTEVNQHVLTVDTPKSYFNIRKLYNVTTRSSQKYILAIHNYLTKDYKYINHNSIVVKNMTHKEILVVTQALLRNVYTL
jgi:hypothetical protein